MPITDPRVDVYIASAAAFAQPILREIRQRVQLEERVLITTLDIPACLRGTAAYNKKVDLDGMNESMNTFNTQGMNKADAVGRQLLLNMLRYASGKSSQQAQ